MRPKGPVSLSVRSVLLVAATLAVSLPLRAQEGGKAVGSANPGAAGREVLWASSIPQAIEMAKAMPNGRLLVELYSENCGECERMEKLIHPATSFFDFTRDKVPVRLDSSSVEGKRIAERFGLRAVPAWVVITTDGMLCGVQVGPSNGPAWFGTFVETERAWAVYRKRLDDEQKHPEDRDLVFAVAEETFKRLGDQLAEPRFQRLGDDPEARLELREKSLAYLATIQLDSQRFDAADATLEKLKAIGRDTLLVQKAELRQADIELARGRKDKAVARLLDFKKAHPDSPLTGQADELLKAIRPGSEVK